MATWLPSAFLRFVQKMVEKFYTFFNKSKNFLFLVHFLVYQWKEDSDTDDDGDTRYSYEKEWDEDLIDSKSMYSNASS